MWCIRTERGTTSIPTKVMQFISGLRHIYFADNCAVSGRLRCEIDYGHRIGLRFLAILLGVEDGDVRECFRRRLHCHARRRIECWIGFPLDHESVSFLWSGGLNFKWKGVTSGCSYVALNRIKALNHIASFAECKGASGHQEGLTGRLTGNTNLATDEDTGPEPY